MNYFCDACKRPNAQEITQFQLETGELVASRSGQNLRPRHRELFVLCSQCSAFAVDFMRNLIAHGGAAGLAASQGSNRPAQRAS